MTRGAILSLEQTWSLARLWYEARLDRDWRRPSADEAMRAFASIGLTGDFWSLG
jgi:hypothetical protein